MTFLWNGNFHVRSAVCVAFFHVQSKVWRLCSVWGATLLRTWNRAFTLCSVHEKNHSDFALHVKWRHRFRDKKSHFNKIFKTIFLYIYLSGVYMTYLVALNLYSETNCLHNYFSFSLPKLSILSTLNTEAFLEAAGGITSNF